MIPIGRIMSIRLVSSTTTATTAVSAIPTGEDRRARVVMNMHGFVRKMEIYLEMNFIVPTGVLLSPDTYYTNGASFVESVGVVNSFSNSNIYNSYGRRSPRTNDTVFSWQVSPSGGVYYGDYAFNSYGYFIFVMEIPI